MSVEVRHGDCIDVMASLEPDSFAACVTDPPYLLEFMGREFDKQHKTMPGANDGQRMQAWHAAWAEQVIRVLKPGAYLCAFASTRGYHRMVCAIEDAGFIIHPLLAWIFGSGFPKAHDLSKALDRAAGVEREVVGSKRGLPGYSSSKPNGKSTWSGGFGGDGNPEVECSVTAPATAPAREWSGWAYGLQSLKPAIEPICLAQKPFADVTSDELRALTGWDHWHSSRSDGDDRIVTGRALHGGARSFRARFGKDGTKLSREDLGEYTPFILDGGTPNVLRWGCGALNIDASRVATEENRARMNNARTNGSSYIVQREAKFIDPGGNGRWPANVAHDGSPEVMQAFARFGQRTSGDPGSSIRNSKGFSGIGDSGLDKPIPLTGIGDTGTAARFFKSCQFEPDELRFHFCGKATKDERSGSSHPTIKPISLMLWLCQLVCPPGGKILDTFAGTGSTLVACDRLGFDALGIEQDAQTVADAHEKIRRFRARRAIGPVDQPAAVDVGQQELGL